MSWVIKLEDELGERGEWVMLGAEVAEAGETIVVAGDQAHTGRIAISERAKAIIFHLEEPVRMGEALGSSDERQRL